MKPETLKLSTLLGAFVLLLLLRAQPLYAAGLRNLAVLRLYPLWLEQAEPILDPPCRAVGTFSDLEQMFQPSIALGNAHGWTHLGRVLWLQARCDEAVDAWERAWTTARDQTAAFELIRVGEYDVLSLETRRMAAEHFYQRAIGYANTRGDPRALAWFSRSFDLMPHHKSASKMAEFYRAADDAAAVRRLWQRLADLTPSGDAEHWWAVAELYGLDNQWEAAARAYTEGARVSVEPYGFWMGAGLSWRLARQWDAAIAAYQRAYEENSAAWTCISIGIVYQARGDHTNALLWYEQAKAKSPKDPESYYRIGETYFSMKDYAQALQYFNEALQIDPDHFLSMYYVARIYYDRGNRDLAEKWMLEALARIPWRDTRAAWWMELGDWRLQWRDCDGARAAYASAHQAGTKEQAIQSKIRKLVEVCVP